MTCDIVIIRGNIVGHATRLKPKENNQDLKIALIEKEGEIARHQFQGLIEQLIKTLFR